MRRKRIVGLFCVAFLLCTVCVAAVCASEGNGWLVLFDGKDLSTWQNAAGGPPGMGWVIEDGVLVLRRRAGYLWTKRKFGDFVLELDFKAYGNSGIFIRTADPRNPVQTGLEVQIYKYSTVLNKHCCGALYDLVAPSKLALKPTGQWNHIQITARGSKITIMLNGEKIVEADLDRWTEAHKNPDGTRNKFNKPIKDFPRVGHIGFQDYGQLVMFRNIRIKPLGEKQGE